MRRCVLGAVLVLFGCGESVEPGPAGDPIAITVSAAVDTLSFLGATEQLVVSAVDENGTSVEVADLTWVSRAPDVVTVNSAGLVTALADGEALVVVTKDALADSLSIVVARTVATVSITPDLRRFAMVGERHQYSATLFDAGGAEMVGPSLAWSSQNASIINVASDGWVEAVGNGVADLILEVNDDTLPIAITVSAPVAFQGATVLPMTTNQRLVDYDVITVDGVISAMGPSGTLTLPSGAHVVEAGGRFLLPGLADMHVHLSCSTGVECANDFFLYLAHGVTTVRSMWGGPFELRARDEVEGGERLAPTLRVASPGMDGPGGGFSIFTPPITSTAQARSTVRQHVEDGYDFIKVYNQLSDPIYVAIHEEAAALGVPVIGHKPFAVTHARTVEMGHWTSEHLLDFEQETTTSGSLWTGEPDLTQVRSRAQSAASVSMGVTPTFAVMGVVSAELAAHRASDAARYVSPGIIDFSTDVLPVWNVPPSQRDTRVERSRDIVSVLHDEGVPILLGTDAGVRWTIPGFSIHDELRELVASGLTPYESLRAGTVTAAAYLGEAGAVGEVAVGMRADLVLLDDDPLIDVAAFRTRAGVMVRGVWLPAAEIDRRLEAIAAGYGR